jgi:hypothetical protein
MFGEAIRERTPGPSVYYVVLAATCFRWTAHSCHSNASALRDVGCKYLVKAGYGAAREQITEFSLAQIGRTGANAFRRQPWTVD